MECLEFSGDGTLLATGGRDNKIALSTVTINDEELHKFSRIQKTVAQKEHGLNRHTRGKDYVYKDRFFIN